MKTIKQGYSGSETIELCRLLDIDERSEFDDEVKNKVKIFQKESHNGG